jgi:hypothetical protein
MQVDVEQRRARHFHAPLQRLSDVLEIVKPPSAVQVYEQMSARITDPISLDEVVLPVVGRYERGLTMIFLLGGA